ncbi:aspartate kinase [Winogradskyella sp. PC-19]|uniref:aspartate kinase n=1 Tax=unclassified Winogradskyella TaxID=2615021 RepID=UPI000B3C7BC6|nr:MULTISPECIES: aspartate kinase [unclassified Winogradskyella]ARV09359.1 aspartate kinase [Winogradskyella sp. PC-19]RZN75830.1 MAG: aspartate kinase [Winogradskyella sp.]
MRQVSLVILGIGNVGSTLIDQIISFKPKLKLNQKIDLKIPVICNSTKALFKDDLDENWRVNFKENSEDYNYEDVIKYVQKNKLQNLIAVDATANEEIVQKYIELIQNNFHLVVANKVANTLDFELYKLIRQTLQKKKKIFYYETNVGAGLPIIETIRNLSQSGDSVKKIRGVFSGSLSYIFNRFSEEDILFSEVLESASNKGYTEPDARDDLSGKDVARKLLVLARELGLKKNLEEVNVQSLVPKSLNGKTTISQFNKRRDELNSVFENDKKNQTGNNVLRYIGELNLENEILEVKLVSESLKTPLGQLKGADNLFEIYTDSYQETPLVIQGAGAGKEVTARGLFSDIVKIANTL